MACARQRANHSRAHGVNAVSKFPTCAVGKFPSTDMVISH
ncbi:hypothetical protein SXCC_03994 [Gluconacetobacter sp. SXCC-1]|nr:hypothetical protein SXCC_03994 [Gluconacetobacter sp. SXCC-1]